MKFRRKLGSVILASSLLVSTAMPHKSYAKKDNVKTKKERSLNSYDQNELTKQDASVKKTNDEAEKISAKQEQDPVKLNVHDKNFEETNDETEKVSVEQEHNKVGKVEHIDLDAKNEKVEETKSDTINQKSATIKRSKRSLPEEEQNKNNNVNIGEEDDNNVLASYNKDENTVYITGNGTLDKNHFQDYMSNKYNNEDTKIIFGKDNEKIKLPQDSSYLFQSFQNKTIDVKNVDTSNVTDMSYMFSEATNANPDVSNWNTSNVTNMSYMFYEAKNADPDVSNWNTYNVKIMESMFSCAKNANPDVSNWNTYKVENMSYMFSGATNANPDVSKWNTINVYDISGMFYEATNANPDVSGWKFNNLSNLMDMFNYCEFKSIDLRNFPVKYIDDFEEEQPTAIVNIIDHNSSPEIIMAKGDFLIRLINESNSSLFSGTHLIYEISDGKDPNIIEFLGSFVGESIDLSNTKLKNFDKGKYYKIAIANKIKVVTDGNGEAKENNSVKINEDNYSVCGEKVTINVTPNPGFEFDRIEVDPTDTNKQFKEEDKKDLNITDNTFVMPSEDATVKVFFKEVKQPVEPPKPETPDDKPVVPEDKPSKSDTEKDKDKDKGSSKDKDKGKSRDKGNNSGNNENKITDSSETIDISKGNIALMNMLNTKDHYAYLFGYKDGSFRPDNDMTRAEVAAMFSRLMLNKAVNHQEQINYSDINTNDWHYSAIQLLNSKGILKGYPDGTFKPDNKITRAEFAAIISRFDTLSDGNSKFSDVDENNWAYKEINSAAAKGWVNGYPDGTFKPDNFITRAEIATVANHMLNREADKNYVESHEKEMTAFNDIKNHWAFFNIEEAANGHDYTRKNSSKEIWTNLNDKKF